MAADIDIVIGAQDKASAMIDSIAGKAGAKLNAGLGGISKKFIGIAAAAAASAAAMFTFSKAAESINEARVELDELAKVAHGLGAAVGDVQAFSFAMGEFAGVDSTVAVDALRELQKSLGEATQGDEGKLELFKQLGIDAKELSLQDPIAQFAALKKGLEEVGTTAQISATAQKLLGGAGKEIIPALLASSEAFDASMQAANDLGLTIDDVGAAGIESMNDALGRAGAGFQGLINQATVQLAPAITAIANALAEWLPPTITFAKEILPDIVDTLGFIAGWAKDIGEILYASSTGDVFGLYEALNSLDSAEEFGNRIDAQRRASQQAAIDALAQQRQLREVMLGLEESTAEVEESAADKTIDALERKLKVLQYGEDLVKAQEQLATATDDIERKRIQNLQDLINKQEEHNDLVKANNDAIKKQEDELAKKREEFAKDKEKIDQDLAGFTAGTSATESRLLTRGPQQKGIDKIADYTESAAESLHRLETLLEQTRQNANTVELEFVG